MGIKGSRSRVSNVEKYRQNFETIKFCPKHIEHPLPEEPRIQGLMTERNGMSCTPRSVLSGMRIRIRLPECSTPETIGKPSDLCPVQEHCIKKDETLCPGHYTCTIAQTASNIMKDVRRIWKAHAGEPADQAVKEKITAELSASLLKHLMED